MRVRVQFQVKSAFFFCNISFLSNKIFKNSLKTINIIFNSCFTMNKFQNIFGKLKCSVISMIHVMPLPGTPNYNGNFNQIIEKVRHEANIYRNLNVDAILVENMHDLPYVQQHNLGPEVTAAMTRLCSEVKSVVHSKTPCGLQILAGGNCEALAVAKVCNYQFIRAEGFVFSHVADEGFTNAVAGTLLRYRKQIDADSIAIFTDLKKKHCSHSITSDVSLLETARAAEFFLTDGIIFTGTATGQPVNVNDVNEIYGKVSSPILMGSGVTIDNIGKFFHKSNAVIIGSHFKVNGQWSNDLDEKRIENFMDKVKDLRQNIE